METKKPWQSKTNWVALLIALAAFFPDAQKFISENPQVFAMGLSGVMFVLRFITKDKIQIKDEKAQAP
jgi:hypothetical protein